MGHCIPPFESESRGPKRGPSLGIDTTQVDSSRAILVGGTQPHTVRRVLADPRFAWI